MKLRYELKSNFTSIQNSESEKAKHSQKGPISACLTVYVGNNNNKGESSSHYDFCFLEVIIVGNRKPKFP